jgi:predicted enzyme related to lactoylglutathione lyase
MLGNAQVFASIPVVELEGARAFYEGTLGLKLAESPDPTVLVFEAGAGTRLMVYSRPTPTQADHTAAGFVVSDVDALVDDLIARGVQFEHYDMPGVEMDERGVAMFGQGKVAWFKDPGGNILSLNS